MLMSAKDAAALVDWQADRDAGCPLCKYNLRGLTSPRCPECGQELQLSIALSEPYYMKAWIGLIAALLPGAGVGGIFALIFVAWVLPVGGPRAFSQLFQELNLRFGLPLLYALLSLPFSILAITLRRRFLKLNRLTQNGIAVLTWLALLICLGLTFGLIH